MGKNKAKLDNKSVMPKPVKEITETVIKTEVDPYGLYQLHEQMQAFILSKLREAAEKRQRNINC